MAATTNAAKGRARAGSGTPKGAHGETPRETPRPARTCVACRAEEHPDAMLRLVEGPDGSLAVDPRERGAKANGRGAWVHPTRSCLETAAKRHAGERSLKIAVQPGLTGEALVSQAQSALKRQAASLVSVGWRTRTLAWGADATHEALRAAREKTGPAVALVLLATDAGRVSRGFTVGDGAGAGTTAGAQAEGTKEFDGFEAGAPVRAFGTREELGLALGRAEVAIAAVLDARIAAALKTTLDRIAGLEGR